MLRSLECEVEPQEEGVLQALHDARLAHCVLDLLVLDQKLLLHRLHCHLNPTFAVAHAEDSTKRSLAKCLKHFEVLELWLVVRLRLHRSREAGLTLIWACAELA